MPGSRTWYVCILLCRIKGKAFLLPFALLSFLQELELLPNLISINHNNFPSQFSTVYVVNHSWTHSGLWACIKRVLPQSALEKIVFLKGEQELADVFDLDRLPKGSFRT